MLNLLDTPGHRDFSEDTLRVLAAADAAVILLDAARGVEAQTLKLFQVARARGIPLLTFVNKYDRPGMEPLEMLDHLEATLGLVGVPLSWPVGPPGEFRGVIDRSSGAFHRYLRTAGGATVAPDEVIEAGRGRAEDAGAWATAEEELALLDAVGVGAAAGDLLTGERTPLFFGSALSNFGVALLLRALIELAPAPAAVRDIDGVRRPLESPFSALVFKVQANMDPRHRDRLAFLRVCSGRFERGMQATNARTGRTVALSYAHELFAQERSVVDVAFPGDVVGIVNAADLVVGDTLYVEQPVRYPAIATLAPEHFVSARNRDPARRKQFVRGLTQLDQEGVVHLLRRRGSSDPVPVLGAVGPLQLEVAVERLLSEFGVRVRLEQAPWTVARRTDSPGAEAVAGARSGDVLERADGTLLAVFPTRIALESFERDHPRVKLDSVLP